ncbi:MAG: aminotransferase class III-fold pyridoxal phosphate-dependent enzyme [Acidiferrobacteraceae bacterium]
MVQKYFTAENLPYFLDRFSSSKTDTAAGAGAKNYLVDSVVPSDTVAISGEGATIQTSHGDLIDFQSMTVNCILGQNDPWVKMQQIAYLLSNRPSFHTTKLGSELYYSLPRRLMQIGLAGIRNPVISHRQCNGSDAVEHAIRAAKNYNADRHLIVSFRGSYHGQNLTAYAVSDVQRKHRFLALFGSVVFLPAPDGAMTIDADVALTESERRCLVRLRTIGRNVFAVILEPIQMNNGVQPFSRAYLEELKVVCDQMDICLIFDEVQTGFGWLGTLSAAEHYGVIPHIAAFGKALTAGNGPLAVTVAEQRFRHMEYGTASKTNGADVRSLVAAHAVIDRLLGVKAESLPVFLQPALAQELNRGLLLSVSDKSAHLWDLMRETQRRCGGIIANLKGGRLICGLEVRDAYGNPSAQMAEAIVNDCLANGLFLRRSHNVLIIKTPLVISGGELADGCEILLRSITRTGQQYGTKQTL